MQVGYAARNRDSEPISGLTACVNAATDQVLSTGSPVDHGHRAPSRKLWHIAGSKRRSWLQEKSTKCLWQEVSTLRQRQQNSAFLPRDAMHRRGLGCHAVSVRPSDTFVDHVKTNKRIFKFFHRRAAPPFYFFRTKLGGDIPTGTSLTGGVECRWGRQKTRFWTNI